MDVADPDRLLALAYAGKRLEKLRFVFAFDEALGRIIATSREPAIAQIKLAWWRENLSSTARSANKGEQMLDAAKAYGLAAELVTMVNGWEVLLGELPLSETALAEYAMGRGGGLFAVVAREYGMQSGEDVMGAGQVWALTDFAFRCSDATTRDTALALAKTISAQPVLPLPLGILAALAKADLARGADRRWQPGSPRRMVRAFSYFLFRR